MKRYLATVTIACIVFGTTTLSAASYWDTILEYLPNWRDFVPGKALPQIEQVQVTENKEIKPKPPSPVAVTKAMVQSEIKKPEPPQKTEAKSVTLAGEAKTAPVKISPRQRRHQMWANRKAAKRAAIQKPVSQPISHPSKTAAPEMVQSIDFSKGMQAVAALMAKPPFTVNKAQNKALILGVLEYTYALSKEAKSSNFSRACAQVNQAFAETFAKKKKVLAFMAGKKAKTVTPFQRLQYRVADLGEAGSDFDVALLTSSFKSALTSVQNLLADEKVNVQAVYGQIQAMHTLASQSGHPGAIQLQRLLAPSENWQAGRTDSKTLEGNINAVLKAL